MSTFCKTCTDACYQPTSPLIGSSVNNVLLQIFPDGYQKLPQFISVLNTLLIIMTSQPIK